jgi:hypothetical protein
MLGWLYSTTLCQAVRNAVMTLGMLTSLLNYPLQCTKGWWDGSLHNVSITPIPSSLCQALRYRGMTLPHYPLSCPKGWWDKYLHAYFTTGYSTTLCEGLRIEGWLLAYPIHYSTSLCKALVVVGMVGWLFAYILYVYLNYPSVKLRWCGDNV